MKAFKDRVAVVTGAASGIGRAMTERFAAEGMKVVLADVEAEALSKAEQELQDQGAATLSVVTDVSNVYPLLFATFIIQKKLWVAPVTDQQPMGSGNRRRIVDGQWPSFLIGGSQRFTPE